MTSKRRFLSQVLGLFLLTLFVAGCSGLPFFGKKKDELAASPRETRWVLIKNPRFGSVASEPEYVWVEEDKIPTTLKTLLFGKKSVLAPREVVAQYGPPPGSGTISRLSGGAPRAAAAGTSTLRGQPRSPTLPAEEEVGTKPKGFVVLVEKNRVVIDLTAQDGVKPGMIVSLRREQIPLTHPVTGEFLGKLDEEIATARIVDIQEKFSVAEIREVKPGFEITPKDRVSLPLE